MTPVVATAEEAPPAPPVLPRGGLGRGLLALARPGQWPKNVLGVSAALLDLDSWRLGPVGRVALAVAAFTLASAAVYVLNDIADRERDRSHPTKRLRAIAAGQVPLPVAVLYAAGLLAALAAVLSTQPLGWGLPLLGYLLLSVAYSSKLKHLPILDVFAVATGFVLRLLQGYQATGTEVSGWLLTCVLAVCLLLTLGKRRHELVVHGVAYRPALRGYTTGLADRLMLLTATLAAVAYLIYLRTEAPLGPYATPAALLSAPLALFGLFRYLQVVEVDQGGENPVRILLRDRPMVVNSALWLLVAAAFLAMAHYPALADLLSGPGGAR